MDSRGERLRRRGGWLVIPFFIASPFLMSFVGVGTTEDQFCTLWGAIPGDDKITRDGNWFLVGEPVANRDPCDGNDLFRYGDGLKGIDAVVWADCQVSWVDGRRSTADAEGLDRCW